MNWETKILDFIQRNRLSTTEVADALGKSGVIRGVQPLTPDQHRAGPVRCIFTAHDSNHALHDQMREIQEGEVVIVFCHDCEGRALLGDLVTRFVALYRRAAALVVVGLVRDVSRLRRERYPIWVRGATPLGCYNEPADPFPEEKQAQLRQRYDGGVAVCDDGGVTVISQDRLTGEMYERLERIEMQEDIWYFCLNTLKWDTKKIVCDKAYLTESELIPETFRQQFDQLEKPLDAPATKSAQR